MKDPERMPAAFVGHGSPMNTLELNRFTASWRALGARLPRPRAILSISAHWFVPFTAVTAMQKPRVIHDFYGFPPALFAFDYPAAGSPAVAQEIVDVAAPAFVGLDEDSWGLDHGTWSVLAHVFPRADIPVVQLSINSSQPLPYHMDLGARLAPLRDRGIFILCSGNVAHNLRLVDFRRREGALPWAERFDAEVQRIMTSDARRLADAERHPDYAMSVPTPDHWLPLAYFAGLSMAEGEAATPFVDGGVLGSLTMTSFVLGCRPPDGRRDELDAGARLLPPDVPPDQTNI